MGGKSNKKEYETFFRSNVFFAPMIDYPLKQNFDFCNFGKNRNQFLSQTLNIIPMTFPKFLMDHKLEMIENYKQIMFDVLASLGAQRKEIKTDMDKVLENELKLAKLSKVEYCNRKLATDADGHEMTLDELDIEVPLQNGQWVDYVTEVLNNPKVTVNGSEVVRTPGLQRMKDFNVAVNRMSSREQSSLLLWRVFMQAVTAFLKSSDHDQYFNDDDHIFEDGPSANSYCLNEMKAFFPDIEDDLIIEKHMKNEENENIKGIFNKTKNEFLKLLDNIKWIDNSSKINARNKLELLKIRVGNKCIASVPVEIMTNVTADDYISNVRILGKFSWSELVNHFRSPKDHFFGINSYV